MKERWIDQIERPTHTDNRTGEEIAADIIQRAGLKVVRHAESI